MRNLAQYLLLSALLLSSVTFCHAQAGNQSSDEPPPPALEYNPDNWKALVSMDGGFEVSMPGKPAYNTHQMETPSGKIPRYSYLLKTNVGSYLVSYFDSPLSWDDPKAVQRALDAERDGILAADKQRKLLSEREIRIEGYAGRELLIRDGDRIVRNRYFIARRRAFQIFLNVPRNVAFRTGVPSSDTADLTEFYEMIVARFFDSFKLIPGGQAASSNGAGGGEPIIVSGGVLNGKAISLPKPSYPDAARAERASGSVVIQVLVDEEGKVISARAVAGHPLLLKESERAARQARFKPMKVEGKPVRVTGVITYLFMAQ
jgi:TonB family protein